jgi:hypothetical protein
MREERSESGRRRASERDTAVRPGRERRMEGERGRNEDETRLD